MWMDEPVKDGWHKGPHPFLSLQAKRDSGVTHRVSAHLSLFRTRRQWAGGGQRIKKHPAIAVAIRLWKSRENLGMREGILGRKRGLQDTLRAVPCDGAGEVPGSTRTWNWVLVVQPETRPHRLCYHEEAEVHTSMGVGSSVCRRLCTYMGDMGASFGSCSALLSREPLLLTCSVSHPTPTCSPLGNGESPSWPSLSLSCPVSYLPRAMRRTRMIRMMVGLMGRAALISISSSVMPMTDSSTMARSSWFHLYSRAVGMGRKAQWLRHQWVQGLLPALHTPVGPTTMCEYPCFYPSSVVPMSLPPPTPHTCFFSFLNRELPELKKHLCPIIGRRHGL